MSRRKKPPLRVVRVSWSDHLRIWRGEQFSLLLTPDEAIDLANKLVDCVEQEGRS